jgi:acyl carrier protein
LLPDGCVRDIQLICKRGREGLGFEIVSADRGAEQDRALAWTSHLTAWGRRVAEAEAAFEGASGAGRAWDLDAVRSRCRIWSSGAEFYSRIWANQGGTGSAFRWIESVWQGEYEALCRAACPSTIGDARRYRLHPGLIEAACQVLHACGSIETRDSIEQRGVTWVPFSVEAFSLFAPQATHDAAWCHALLRDATWDHVEADLTIFSASGDVVARLEGFCLRRITRDAITGIGGGPPALHPPARGLASADEGAASGLAPSGAAILDPAHITAYLQRQCAVLSGHPEADVAPGASFIDLGLDSIAAVSLANDIARAFGRTVPVVRILSCVSLAALADAICDEPGGGRASIRSSARATGHDLGP